MTKWHHNRLASFKGVDIVIDPSCFVGLEEFKEQMSQTLDELGAVRPAPGYDKVYYPGERALARKKRVIGSFDALTDQAQKMLVDYCAVLLGNPDCRKDPHGE